MESMLDNLSLNDKPKFVYSFTQYRVKGKYELLSVFLPDRKYLQNLIKAYNKPENISFDLQKFSSFLGMNNIIDFTSLSLSSDESQLKTLCGFLGSINSHNNLFSIINTISSKFQPKSITIENCSSFDQYIQKNKDFLFSKFKLVDLQNFIETLKIIGITINPVRENDFYMMIKRTVMKNDKIAIIIAGNENLWMRLQTEEVNGFRGIHQTLNKYLYFNDDFINEYFKRIANHPRCFFCIINSMKWTNWSLVLQQLESHDDFPEDNLFFTQRNHSYFKSNSYKTKFVRSINEIEKGFIKRKKYGYDKTNFIILESDQQKIGDPESTSIPMKVFPENYYYLPQTETDALKVLEMKYIDYIENLLENCIGDVRTYLENHPFEK